MYDIPNVIIYILKQITDFSGRSSRWLDSKHETGLEYGAHKAHHTELRINML